MSSSLLGLPPVPPDLKAIAPYLQRAEELKNQDPVASYWCAYYAAQAGIALKARSTPARDLLLALLTTLENMKADIGSNDAIHIESVSSAYMENFALKVFANADNEDRAGRATRATAKKFLAAANFLEVLKTFPKSELSEANEDKIRYAKWKAADIGKAFREGRKPAPGPPGWAEEQEELKALALEQEERNTLDILSPPKSHPDFSSTQTHSPPRSSPPHPSHTSSSPPKPNLHFEIGKLTPGWPANPNDPQESWSTSATPGTEPPDICAIGATPPPSSSHERSGSGSSLSTLGSNGAKGTRAWTNEELADKFSPSSTPPKSSFKSGSPDSDKRVHFSPSIAGSPPPYPPPRLTVSGSPPQRYLGPSSIYGPPELSMSPHDPHYNHPSLPTYPAPQPPPPIAPPSLPPPRSYDIYAQPSPPQVSLTQYSYTNHPPPPPPPPPFELTPGIIGKAQKHCRFAISALDYEDAEQAKKELRAALTLLGG